MLLFFKILVSLKLQDYRVLIIRLRSIWKTKERSPSQCVQCGVLKVGLASLMLLKILARRFVLEPAASSHFAEARSF